MKNRFVRWIIYFAVGVAIGVGVSYYNKQKSIDEGVVELSPDAVQEEDIAIPSRVEEAVETFSDDVEEAGEVLKDAGAAAKEKAMEAIEGLKEMVPAEEVAPAEDVAEEATEEVEESAPAVLTPMPE